MGAKRYQDLDAWQDGLTLTKRVYELTSHARSSAMEVQSILHIALVEGYISKRVFEELYELCNRIRARITALIKYLRKSA